MLFSEPRSSRCPLRLAVVLPAHAGYEILNVVPGEALDYPTAIDHPRDHGRTVLVAISIWLNGGVEDGNIVFRNSVER